MPFALRLFRLNIYNSYYQAQVGDDCSLIPTEETQQWMQQYPMKLVSTPGAFELMWMVAGLAAPLKTLKKKIHGKKLTYYLILKNPEALSFSELSIEHGQAYYFHNQGTGARLHQKSYVSLADKVAVPETRGNHLGTEKSFLALVDIYLEELWKKDSFDLHRLPVTYSIHIKARKTIWRYCIVDKNFRIKSPMKVVLDNEDTYFNYETDKKRKMVNMHVYKARKPLALTDKPERFFSLKTYHPDKPEEEKTLIKKLPLPTNASLRKDNKNSKVLYNDIFVYV